MHRGGVGDQRKIDRLASKQHGVFSLVQARDAGFDRSAVHRRVHDGSWTRLDHSVYAVSSSPATWERQVMAAVASRPQALAGHATAAYLLGLPGFRKTRPVLVVPDGSNLRSELARVIESDRFGSLASTTIKGIPTTTLPETLLALVADVGAARFEEVFDQALLKGLLDLDAMKGILDREAGRRPRGIRLLRRLTKERLPSAPTQDSTYLEAILERVLAQSDVPGWTREHPFSLMGRPARVDVYIPAWRLVIEADGRNWHLRRADFENDRHRDNELAARGIQVLRYTYRMLTDDSSRCAMEITQVGRVRAAQRSA